MFGKILFLISVCMFIEIGYCGHSNEHVHIKLHIPEIIKRHTHVRTVYKHHHKPKSHKPKKGSRHHHNPKMKHSIASKYQATESRPHYVPKLPHFNPVASEEIEPINEWQHKLETQTLKKPKHFKKNPYALLEMMAEAGGDESSYDGFNPKLYKQFQLKGKLKNQHMVPDYMVMDSSLNFGQEGDDQYADVYTAAPKSAHFQNPQLLKITEDDIRDKVPNSYVPMWGYDGNSQEIAKFKKPNEWPKVSSSALAYQYTTLAPLHLSSDVEDDDEFMPSALIKQTKYTSLDEYPNLFESNKPKQMDLQYTYTKYKNRQSMKNAMSNLNTRVN